MLQVCKYPTKVKRRKQQLSSDEWNTTRINKVIQQTEEGAQRSGDVAPRADAGDAWSDGEEDGEDVEAYPCAQEVR